MSLGWGGESGRLSCEYAIRPKSAQEAISGAFVKKKGRSGRGKGYFSFLCSALTRARMLTDVFRMNEKKNKTTSGYRLELKKTVFPPLPLFPFLHACSNFLSE